MNHETVNTGFVFLVLYCKDVEKGTTSFENALHESNNPYNTFIEIRAAKPYMDITLVNWAFISKENYLKLKNDSHALRKHVPNGTTNGRSL